MRTYGRWLLYSTAAVVVVAGAVAVTAVAQSGSAQPDPAPLGAAQAESVLPGPTTAAVNWTSTVSARSGRPSAIVSLGDSYMAGEGGRWKGNSADAAAGHQGTDRGSQVYGYTDINGCHRSDVAEIISAGLPVRKTINLACAGAQTVNVLRESVGGVDFKGEAPQNDQLATVAKNNDVKLIVLSIGGNDFGFSKIVTGCVAAFLQNTKPCKSKEASILAGLPKVTAAVTATLADVRATMATAGYKPEEYRLVLQSYPSFAPSKSRYVGTAADDRAKTGGCPFLDTDVSWARKVLLPALTDGLAGVAKQTGTQFLDLRDAFQGHEPCAASAKQSTGDPSSASSEWFRFVDMNGQGSTSESLHPNY
ncbi:MAG TPA: hypothetical protein VLL08_25560, partial [Kineosporiaceae bacterium]|nr:hypothetical protein [Kineosporiaceae bacterium]